MIASLGFLVICIGLLLAAVGLVFVLNVGSGRGGSMRMSSTANDAIDYVKTGPRRIANRLILAGLSAIGVGGLLMWAGGA